MRSATTRTARSYTTVLPAARNSVPRSLPKEAFKANNPPSTQARGSCAGGFFFAQCGGALRLIPLLSNGFLAFLAASRRIRRRGKAPTPSQSPAPQGQAYAPQPAPFGACRGVGTPARPWHYSTLGLESACLPARCRVDAFRLESAGGGGYLKLHRGSGGYPGTPPHAG